MTAYWNQFDRQEIDDMHDFFVGENEMESDDETTLIQCETGCCCMECLGLSEKDFR